MPTTDPAPEWDWYSSVDLSIGEARSGIHSFLYDDEYEEYLEELREKEKRRIKPGFHVQDSKRPVPQKRSAKARKGR